MRVRCPLCWIYPPSLPRGLAAVLIALTLSMLWAPSFAVAGERLNVLFLLADDQRADAIGALGHPVLQTPHMDGLVRRGFQFRNAYCLGSNSPAVCTPSRNMLLSGRTYFRWRGNLAPADGPNFPVTFRDAGYQTYHHGKRGNTATLIQEKFETNLYLKDDEAERRSGEPGQEIVDRAIQFLHQRDASRPFCMYLAFGNPHDPRVAAPRYRERYQASALPLPANFLPVHPFNNGEMTIRDEKLAPWPRTEAEIRKQLHDYYAVLTAMDGHIGRLLGALDELQLTDKTLIVYSSDHGLAMGSHGLMGKQSLYDHSMRVPLIFAGPGIPQGTSAALVYLHDIYPTLCGLTSTPVPTDLDGVTLHTIIQGKQTKVRDTLACSYRDVQRAIRDERWKVIRYPQINRTQLFDLQNDPQETQDLSAQPEHAERIRELLEQLQRWQSDMGDTLPLTRAQPLPAEWSPPAP